MSSVCNMSLFLAVDFLVVDNWWFRENTDVSWSKKKKVPYHGFLCDCGHYVLYMCLKSLQTDHKGAVEFYFELPNALPCIKINTIKCGFFFFIYTYMYVHFVVFNAVLLTITTVFITLQKIL